MCRDRRILSAGPRGCETEPKRMAADGRSLETRGPAQPPLETRELWRQLSPRMGLRVILRGRAGCGQCVYYVIYVN